MNIKTLEWQELMTHSLELDEAHSVVETEKFVGII